MAEDYTITQVLQAIKRAWSHETSYVPEEWSESNRARGQCVVSALVINDYFGGVFERFEVSFDGGQEKHYVNVLSDGVVIDVAGMQYTSDAKRVPSPGNSADPEVVRNKLLEDEGTAERYELLKKRVKVLLKEGK